MTWHGESQRHSLSAQGIRTGTKVMLLAAVLEPNKDTDRDGLSNRYDCKPLSKEEQGKIHDFFDKLFHKKELEHPESAEKIVAAREESRRISTFQSLKSFVRRHREVLILLGLTGLIFAVTTATGSAGQLMMNVRTGEIVRVGGTALGRLGTIVGVGVGGFALGEGMREELISEEEQKIEEKIGKEEAADIRQKLEKEEQILEEAHGLGRKSGEVPVFEEGLQAKAVFSPITPKKAKLFNYDKKKFSLDKKEGRYWLCYNGTKCEPIFASNDYDAQKSYDEKISSLGLR